MLLNKVELAGERRVDEALDDLNELVPDVPKVRTAGARGDADPALVFGLDGALLRGAAAAQLQPSPARRANHFESDVETLHVLPGALPAAWRGSRADLQALADLPSPIRPLYLYISTRRSSVNMLLDLSPYVCHLQALADPTSPPPPDDLYRAKGLLRLEAAEGGEGGDGGGESGGGGGGGEGNGVEEGGDGGGEWWLFNLVAGKLTLERLPSFSGPTSLVFMGRDLDRWAATITERLRLPREALTRATPASALGGGALRGLCLPCPRLGES